MRSVAKRGDSLLVVFGVMGLVLFGRLGKCKSVKLFPLELTDERRLRRRKVSRREKSSPRLLDNPRKTKREAA